nr:long chain acyl-CoA synthetase 4-like isoform X3 [Physcomitrium patens]|eukprot:XP_024379414.1 long chain acyl-CoA synthetase 4-like isoform X3 [Physcomitrella patens]
MTNRGDQKSFVVMVEEGQPGRGEGELSKGAVYKSIYSQDGLDDLHEGMQSTWDSFVSSNEDVFWTFPFKWILISCHGKSKEIYPDKKMLGRREMVNGSAGDYVWLTYEEVYNIVINLGAAIRYVGVQPKSKVGIYGANCSEWFMAMEACNAQSMLCVPLYETLGNEAVEYIINHAEVSIAFVQDTKLDLILATLPKCTKLLKKIVSFSTCSAAQRSKAEASGAALLSWDEFLKLGKNNPTDLTPPTTSDISTIMYTSGTTGEPKGVLLSHANILCAIIGYDHFLRERGQQQTEKDVYYSFLPLAHIFDRLTEELFVFLGASIGYWQGDVKKITEDLAVLKPTLFVAVPRVYNRIHAGIFGRINAGGGAKRMMFHYAFDMKLKSLYNGFKHDKAAPILDKIIFNKVKMAFGGNVKCVISGAAPLPSHLEEFLRVVTCAPVVQGYGLTESCAATFIQVPDVISMHGTVGPPLPNIEVRLVSVPEMGYDALGKPARGEICIRSKTLFSGYYKRPDLTDEVLVDGWFSTGDVGEWQEDGAMKIIDRKKNIFKLSQGEYVAVENLESIYGQCELVDQIWVYGNSLESTLVAVCVPNQPKVEEWAKNNGLMGDFARICRDPKTHAHIMAALNATGKAKKVKGFEVIRGVVLEPLPFDMERDLVTPTFKLKRSQLLQYYKTQIDELYATQKQQ